MSTETISWSPGISLAEIEKQVILKAFRFYRGHQPTTAQALGISIKTLYNKLEQYETEGNERIRQDVERRAKDADFLNRQRGLPSSYSGAQPTSGDAAAPKRELLPGADAGVRLESAQESPAQPAMPMSQRAQVQSVLPQPTPAGGPRKAR